MEAASNRKGDGAVLAQAKERCEALEASVGDGAYKAQAQEAAKALGMPMQVVQKKKAKRASRSFRGAG